MKHINIPIFIPHLGCPNQCIFCNQRYISGTEIFCEDDVKNQIDQVLSTVTNEKCEIAFFGGSFTGIDRSLMIRLLDLAQEYINIGKASGIRMSTRPDYISKEITDILSKYSISCVELGIQTINDDVLKVLKRGHTARDSIEAINCLKKAGLPFAGQMMIGLPKASLDDEINTARFIAENGAIGARIYPTVVFNNTELAQMYNCKEYSPLSEDDAVFRSAKALNVFVKADIPCFRIGLCDSENLHSDETFVAGPNGPSIGERVKSRLFFDIIVEQIYLLRLDKGDSIIIECPKGKASQIIGLRKENIVKLKDKFDFKEIKVLENESLVNFNIKILKKEDNHALKIT